MSSPGSAQPPTDYYREFGLDSRSPSHALLAQLSHRITSATIGPERTLMEQARAVLGDPGKKRVYDARLRDPQAPPWTPQELHQLALAAPSRSTGGGLLAQLKTTPTRIMAGVAAGLLVVLVVIVTAVACTGGTADVANDHASADTSSRSGTDAADCLLTTIDDDGHNRAARWDPEDEIKTGLQPRSVVVLTNEYELPASFTDIASPDFLTNGATTETFPDLPYRGLTQFQNQSIGVLHGDGNTTSVLAVLSQDGKVQGVYDEATKSRAPQAFDLANKQTFGGYYRVEAADGTSIPSAARGTEPNQYRVTAMLRDAFDKYAVWLLMKGSSSLYKARVYMFSNPSKVGTKADLSTCREPAN